MPFESEYYLFGLGHGLKWSIDLLECSIFVDDVEFIRVSIELIIIFFPIKTFVFELGKNFRQKREQGGRAIYI